VAVVAFGGNALLEPGDVGTTAEQKRRAEEAARWLAAVVEGGRELVVVHGNGPQVGQVLIQMEEAATKIPPGSLDLAVAQTQGAIGFLLETALRNRLEEVGLARADGDRREVAILLSLVVVDRDDPGFAEPTKPVGPFFSRYRAELLEREHGWTMVHDAGRGWRKVVPSPRPLEILGVPAVRALLARGDVVIAGGGGGIPVVRRADGALEGIEAVIDKDRTAALLARELGADLLINLTGVSEVRRGFGTGDERPLPRLTVAEARRLLAAGEFPAGSMGPKIESAVEFVAATGNRVLITDIDTLPAALAGDGGTLIVPAEEG
jgi:carbamate kinase